jgi:creatinine amidohydrolase
MTGTLRLDRLAPARIREHLAVEGRLLMAVGSLESHGPNLPLGTGTHMAEAVVERVSARTGILQAPPLPYGVHRRRNPMAPGAAGLRRKTLHRTVNELLAGWEDHGVSEFLIVSAQRSEAHVDALLMALTSRATTTVFDLLTFDLGALAPRTVADDAASAEGWLDRAVMAYLDPETVPGTSAGDAELGEAILEHWTDTLVDTLGAGGPGPARPGPG